MEPFALTAAPGPSGFSFVFGSANNDLLSGTAGRDLMIGQDGHDTLSGGAGLDLMLAGAGNDHLQGGAGFDIMIGGDGGDTYEIDVTASGADVIVDQGNAAALNGSDELLLNGFTSEYDAIHQIGIQISGDDLVFTYDSGSGAGTVTISDHFRGAAFALEQVNFGTGRIYHVSMLSGDQFTYSVHDGPDEGGEDIVLGTSGADEIHGGIGNDLLVGGGGADHFMFQDEGDATSGHDIIQDFQAGQDKIDFSDQGGMTMADLTITDSSWGNAVITSTIGEIELLGIAASEVDSSYFFFG